MSENPQNSFAELVSTARQRLIRELRAQAEDLEKLQQSLQELRSRHQQLEEAIEQELARLKKFEFPAPPAPSVTDVYMEGMLGSVRNLITATLPEQVFDVLTEEAKQMGVRAAVFDVRGKAAWGASAQGFGAELPSRAFRALVVPLNQDNPFRQVYETGGHVDASVELLRRNRSIIEKLRPRPQDPILLLPIRSGGSVSAIFYADPAEEGKALPVDALKILTEFAGAQLDRLMALGGGPPSAPVEAELIEAEPVAAPVEAPVEAPQPEAVGPVVSEEIAAAVPSAETEAIPVAASAPAVDAPPPLPVPPARQEPVASAGIDVSQLSEADQKIHRDAKRFAKLLVSEIELYNKAKVADGRKSKDVYKRLKSDIDRSRQTYEKRFGKTLAKQFDYFHDELVRTLASNDPAVLGSDYPGPSA